MKKNKPTQQAIFGINSVNAVFQRDPSRIMQLFLRDHDVPSERVNAIKTQAETMGISLSHHDKRFFDEHFQGNHQGVAAYIKAAKPLGENDLKQWLKQLPDNPLILILDQVQDPHNLGAILRTADAAGVDAVIVNDKNTAPLNATARKIASGAAETTPLYRVSNLVRAIEQLKAHGIWITGTTDHAEKTLFQHDLSGPLGLIMGSEGSGMRRLTENACDFLVKLPMAGVVSSLNVSVAAGVCLYEINRQRGC